MKKSELIKILETYPGDPEIVAELPDGEVSVPVRYVATYDNSTTPDCIHLVTRVG